MADTTRQRCHGKSVLSDDGDEAAITRVCLDGEELQIVRGHPTPSGAVGGASMLGRLVGAIELDGRRYTVYSGGSVQGESDDLLSRLTPRELEIACLIAAGAVNKTIAQRLGISPFTVGAHINRIFCKTGVRSRAALSAQVVHRLGKVPV
jgi:DNA-binding CsgD family transcriptional regulator